MKRNNFLVSSLASAAIAKAAPFIALERNPMTLIGDDVYETTGYEFFPEGYEMNQGTLLTQSPWTGNVFARTFAPRIQVQNEGWQRLVQSGWNKKPFWWIQHSQGKLWSATEGFPDSNDSRFVSTRVNSIYYNHEMRLYGVKQFESINYDHMQLHHGIGKLMQMPQFVKDYIMKLGLNVT